MQVVLKILIALSLTVASLYANLLDRVNANMVREIYGLDKQIDIEIDKSANRVHLQWFDKGLCMLYLESQGSVKQSKESFAKMGEERGYSYFENIGTHGAYYQHGKGAANGLSFMHDGIKYKLTSPHIFEDKKRVEYTKTMAQALIK